MATVVIIIETNSHMRVAILHYIGKAELLQLKIIHLFARDILLIKRLEIGKNKPIFIISDLKVEYSVVSIKTNLEKN